ncbi:hypothetical protein [Streptomyces niveus]
MTVLQGDKQRFAVLNTAEWLRSGHGSPPPFSRPTEPRIGCPPWAA